jgi:C1A family cysteine protease
MSFGYQPVVLTDTGAKVGSGWLPPLPDLRDYTDDNAKLQQMVKALNLKGAAAAKTLKATTSVDLRPDCSPIENQKSLGSCTAHAAVGCVEYFEKRAFGKHIDGSRLFIYKATRDLMQVTGDTGAWLRNTMGALRLCGVPPEKYWPYTDADPDFDQSPGSFVYAVADNYEAVSYFCHDPLGAGRTGAAVLASVKKYLVARIPSMFGFWGFSSFDFGSEKGSIPYPGPGEQAEWGHAIVAVGFDDEKKVTNTVFNQTTTGALLIRNSWGTSWGQAGYGWLPYKYVENRLATDFWSLLSMQWVETGQFGL